MITLLNRFALIAVLWFTPGARGQDENFYVFLCLGQSNMEGFPGIPEEDKAFADSRFQVLAAVDFPALNREQGNWYTAVPPLCRPNSGLSPADFFGRTMIAMLPGNLSRGVWVAYALLVPGYLCWLVASARTRRRTHYYEWWVEGVLFVPAIIRFFLR